MKIHLEFSAVLHIEKVKSGDMFEVEDEATIRHLLEALGIRSEHRKYVVPSVNGKQGRITTVLHDGDHVHLALPMGGG